MTGYIDDLIPGMLFTDRNGEQWEFAGYDGYGFLCEKISDGDARYFDPDTEIYDIIDPYA